MKGTMKLADHAELWWTKQGKELPARGTPEWQSHVRDLGDLGVFRSAGRKQTRDRRP